VITLGPKSFSGWPAARKYLVDLTRSQPVGATIEGEALEVIEAALPYHSEFELKVGPGVYRFTVKRHPAYPNTQCVFVERVDQTSVAVSFQNIGKTVSQVKRKDRLRALREAVVSQILRYKDGMFPEDGWEVQCPLTGELVTKSTCDVDHAPPSTFAQLVEDWLKAEGLSLEEIEIHPPPHPKCELRSAILTVSWQDYHAAHADLRILSLEGHKRVTAENQKGGA